VRMVFLLTLLLAGPVSAAVLDDYIKLATGSFTSAAQAATDSRYDAVTWHIAEIWRDNADAERWLYTESWMDGADAPYMQRVSSVVEQDDGSLLVRRYRLPDATGFVGAWRAPSRFEATDPGRLAELAGCEAVLVRGRHARPRLRQSLQGRQLRDLACGRARRRHDQLGPRLQRHR